MLRAEGPGAGLLKRWRSLEPVSLEIEFHGPCHVAQRDAFCKLFGFLLGPGKVSWNAPAVMIDEARARLFVAVKKGCLADSLHSLRPQALTRRIVKGVGNDAGARRAGVNANLNFGARAGRWGCNPCKAYCLSVVRRVARACNAAGQRAIDQ